MKADTDHADHAGRSIGAAIAGVSILLTVIFMLYQGGRRIYYDYYFYAQVKEHYIPPDARQRVMDAMVITVMLVALYLACRLLKYAWAHRPQSPSNR